MTNALDTQRIAILATDGVERVEADVVRGRTITSWPSVRTDLRNAGADVVDREVVVDGALVSSRRPDDLPAFCAAIAEAFARGRQTAPAGGA
jgi:protease I